VVGPDSTPVLFATAAGPTKQSGIDEVVEFTKYEWVFRYPGNVEEPSAVEAAAVLQAVRGFVEAMIIRLPE
jgi:hypothetical protein